MLRQGLFNAKVSKGPAKRTISLGSPQGNITLIGSSLPVSCRPGDEVSSLTIRPDPEAVGVIAVSVYDRGRTKEASERIACLFAVGHTTDGESRINLENAFECDGERLGEAHWEGFVEVWVGVESYHSFNTDKFPQYKRSGRYVPDPNLLCRYLVGTASADEVKAAALKVEEDQTELEELRAKVSRLTELGIHDLTKLSGLNRQLEEERNRSEAILETAKFWRGVAFALWAVLRKFGPLFQGFARKLCDSPRFKRAYANFSSWTYPTEAFDRMDKEDFRLGDWGEI
ncbi:MAG: hypothetical protein Q7S57_05860 [bacterium]|nr:hypothetical protein [bacterium]